LIGVVMGTASNAERDQHMTMLLDDSFHQVNGSTSRFGGSLISLANAATTYTIRPASPGAESGRSVLAARIPHDRAVQIGAYHTERTASDVAREAIRLAPSGQPRVQPVMFGRRTLYHAQLLGLSEVEARSVCASLARRVPACQVFRINEGATAQR